jgi:hypothetical protein
MSNKKAKILIVDDEVEYCIPDAGIFFRGYALYEKGWSMALAVQTDERSKNHGETKDSEEGNGKKEDCGNP